MSDCNRHYRTSVVCNTSAGGNSRKAPFTSTINRDVGVITVGLCIHKRSQPQQVGGILIFRIK